MYLLTRETCSFPAKYEIMDMVKKNASRKKIKISKTIRNHLWLHVSLLQEVVYTIME